MSLATFGFEIEQRIEEAITYRVTTTAWRSSPAAITAVLYDLNDGTDVSDTCLKGTAQATGDVITLPQVLALEENHNYFLDVTFEAGGDTFAFFLRVHGLR